MTSPHKKTPVNTPKYHRSVFGNITSPNMLNQNINSIYASTAGILSPNFNVVNADWGNKSDGKILKRFGSNNNLRSSSSRPRSKSRSGSFTSYSFSQSKTKTLPENDQFSFTFSSQPRPDSNRGKPLSQQKTFGDLFNAGKKQKSSDQLTDDNDGNSRKLRRINTNEHYDRFIPSRQTTSGKLTLEKTKSLPSFAMPIEHIESKNSEIYQNSVAKACGLEVGQRILQFQPVPPESSLRRTSSTTNNGVTNSLFKTRPTISTNAITSRMKKIPSCPTKVLDAPGLVDDFYLNLISWSNDNVLAISLNRSVYCWNANNGQVDLIAECDSTITSIKWSPDDYYLSIGLDNGNIEIWDVETKSKSRTMKCFNGIRIATQSWNDHILSNGSRGGIIMNNDVRVSEHIIDTYENHSGEVCGLEWRSDGLQLASGGNDNLVNIWDIRNSSIPMFTKTAHNAAVKAISWCPEQPSLLATGGGSACKNIHFWNSNTGVRVNTIETGSQVSSLKWGYSKNIGLEILSTHGYPNNEISIFSYKSLQKIGEIKDAHDSRILNSELSPNGTILATIASDENLKFWKLFDEKEKEEERESYDVSNSQGKGLGKAITIR